MNLEGLNKLNAMVEKLNLARRRIDELEIYLRNLNNMIVELANMAVSVRKAARAEAETEKAVEKLNAEEMPKWGAHPEHASAMEKLVTFAEKYGVPVAGVPVHSGFYTCTAPPREVRIAGGGTARLVDPKCDPGKHCMARVASMSTPTMDMLECVNCGYRFALDFGKTLQTLCEDIDAHEWMTLPETNGEQAVCRHCRIYKSNAKAYHLSKIADGVVRKHLKDWGDIVGVDVSKAVITNRAFRGGPREANYMAAAIDQPSVIVVDEASGKDQPERLDGGEWARRSTVVATGGETGPFTTNELKPFFVGEGHNTHPEGPAKEADPPAEPYTEKADGFDHSTPEWKEKIGERPEEVPPIEAQSGNPFEKDWTK